MQTAFKTYKKEFEHSYSFGAFPTIEMIKARPEKAIKVFAGSSYREQDELLELCAKNGIEFEVNDKAVSRLSPKENCLVIGVFRKYECKLETNTPHTALQNPGNMGNLGTIIRTMLGFGIHDLAIIGSGADILDPKVVRASMGAVFRIRFAHFDTIESYAEKFGGHDLYPFMLDGELTLSELPEREDKPFTLIFGNEAAGLDEHYRKIGKSVVIKHSGEIDSLNLSIAAGIAFYEFTKRR